MTAPVISNVRVRRLKIIQFVLATTDYSCQLNSWTMTNNTSPGDKTFTFCPNSEFRTETNDDWAMTLKFFSDWRVGGISTFLTTNNRTSVAFQLDHHPEIVGEHVRWTGNMLVLAPTVGGDVRITEETTVTFQIYGVPLFQSVG